MRGTVQLEIYGVFVKSASDGWGCAEWMFDVRADGERIGNKSKNHRAEKNRWIKLGGKKWSRSFEVSRNEPLVLSVKVTEDDLFCDDFVGKAKLTLRWPFAEKKHVLETKHFKAYVRLRRGVFDTYGTRRGNGVFACRENGKKAQCITIKGAAVERRVEICPIYPTPAEEQLPRRLDVPGKVLYESDVAGEIFFDFSHNFVPNPSVIPVLADAEADAFSAAQIRCTYYQPSDLDLQEEDARLVWTAVALDGKAKVKFVGKPHGTSALVYGKCEGEVRLELRLEGTLVAVYRALVRKIRKLPYRVTIYDGGKRSRPVTDPVAIHKHVEVANRLLRQAGVELVADDDDSASDGAVRLARGIFCKRFPRRKRYHTMNIPIDDDAVLHYNYRKKVLQIIYVHSFEGDSALGVAYWQPETHAPDDGYDHFVTDQGTPSSSWQAPSGVWPQGKADEVKIGVLAGDIHPDKKHLWAVAIANHAEAADSDDGIFAYGSTLAHEVGHFLSLDHRNPGEDGLRHPATHNVMYPTSHNATAQDFDLIQAKAMQLSKAWD